MRKRISHYDWLDANLITFLQNLGMSKDEAEWNRGLISAHGDKCYTYKEDWEKKGIAFEYGVAIYLLTYVLPWSREVRETANGWVDPHEWVIDNKDRFLKHLPPPINISIKINSTLN